MLSNNLEKYKKTTDFIRTIYPGQDFVPLHAPVFFGNEKKYLNDCIDTTYVSYVGKYVTQFEEELARYLGVKYAVAVVNGTAALQIALQLIGVQKGVEVLTQSLTFVATANAITHAGGSPIFIDSELMNFGMDPEKLEMFLNQNGERKGQGNLYNKITGNRIAACVPVHVFGHPARIDDIMYICNKWGIPVVEDAAESIGSTYNGKHMGTYGIMGILSFNGNKTITTGGGGMIVTNNEEFALRAKHITTTAKIPHPWEFNHDEVGYNYRMTNVNAAIGCAQMERIDLIIANKRETAIKYASFFKELGIQFFSEKQGCRSNYWLNTIILEDRIQRDEFLKYCNSNGIMVRPAWILMSKLPMYNKCISTGLEQAQWLEDRIVNLPSSITQKT